MINNPEHFVQFGPHYAQTKESVVYICFQGDFFYEEAKLLLGFIERSFGKRPYYAICDIKNQGTITPEARKLLSEWTKDKQLTASTMIGGNPVARVLTILIGNAIRLFNKKAIAINFVKDLQQAQEWIDEQRRQNATRKT